MTEARVMVRAGAAPGALRRLAGAGTELWCVDLASVPPGSVEAAVRAAGPVTVGVVTEGPHVRTGLVAGGAVVLGAGDIVRLTGDKLVGDHRGLSLRPAALFDSLCPGTRLAVDGGPLLRVGRRDEGAATAIAVDGGEVGSNRLVTVDPVPALPPLTPRDRRGLEAASAAGVRHVVLSAATAAPDIDAARRQAPGAEVVALLETRSGLWNREEVIRAADAVAVDPVALLRELPVEQVALAEEVITRLAARWRTPVYRAVPS